MSYKDHYTNVLQKTITQMSYKKPLHKCLTKDHYTNILQKLHKAFNVS